MTSERPIRPPGPAWARCACMIFGLITMVSGVFNRDPDHPIFLLAGGILVGAAWFAFGAYGGLPLVDTVKEWCPSTSHGQIDEVHRQGLRVMRRRKWLGWLAIPLGVVAMAAIAPLLNPIGQPEIVLLLVFPPLAILYYRYHLSRCPRCGYGFFARSTNRMAFLQPRKDCAHCGLPLDGYRETLEQAARSRT